jgi:hypothetical protein
MDWGYLGVVDFQGRHLMREKAMYACNREIGHSLFATHPTALRFASGAAPVSPHAQHVDDYNEP